MKSKISNNNKNKPGPKPPAVVTRMVKGIKCNFSYMKTVHSLQELDDFCFEHQCDCANARSTTNFKIARMRCHKANSARGGCQFVLLAIRAALGSTQLHVYAYSKHNHAVKPAERRGRNKFPKNMVWPDEHPLASFITPSGRQWTFLETTDKEQANRDIEQLDKVRRKFHCSYRISVKQKEAKRFYSRVTLYCSMTPITTCSFAVLAQKTDRARFHLYTSGEHTCLHKDKEKSAVLRNALFSDADPPASFTTQINNRHWIYSETILIEEKEGILHDILLDLLRKFHCRARHVKQAVNEPLTMRRVILHCTLAMSSKCPYAILLQKTDRKGRFHIYESETHTCLHKDGEKHVLPHYAVLPDALPPAKVSTSGDQQWTFLETTETGIILIDVLRMIRRKYSCIYPKIKRLSERCSAVCRLQLYCTTKNAATGKCPFKLLAQKTDRGRYHLYAFGRHTCFHANEGARGRCHKDEEDDDEEVLEKDEDLEEEKLECDEEQEDEENENSAESIDDEKEKTDEKIEDEEEEEDEYRVEGRMEQKYEVEDEEDNGDDYNDQEALPTANNLRSRSPTVPHEINDVQFVDVVDHPKCEGVKMHRLGEEPKKEPRTDNVMITLEEEGSSNGREKVKMPKREVVKEEAPEEQPGPSNKEQQQHTAIGTAALPMAGINRQNQQSVVTRVRWWAEPAVGQEAMKSTKPKRLLRERKLRINYRE